MANENSANEISKNNFAGAVFAKILAGNADGRPKASEVSPSCFRKILRWFMVVSLRKEDMHSEVKVQDIGMGFVFRVSSFRISNVISILNS